MFKIMPWPLARVFEVLGWLFSGAMTVVVTLKGLRYPGLKDFLDR